MESECHEQADKNVDNLGVYECLSNELAFDFKQRMRVT